MSVKLSPVVIRSTSPSFSTSNNSTSNDDILKAIEFIRLAQDKLLTGHKTLGHKLKTSINALTSRFDALSLEITDLLTY